MSLVGFQFLADTYCISCAQAIHPRVADPDYEEAYDDYVSLLRAPGRAPEQELKAAAQRIAFDRERNPVHPIYADHSWDHRIYCGKCTVLIETAVEKFTCPDCDLLIARGEVDFHYVDGVCGDPDHWTVLGDG